MRKMDDDRIIELYWTRDEKAISATAEKYGSYCGAIARNILGNESDAEECVNDTWLSAWRSIPPNRPTRFSVFLGKMTRNLAFNQCVISLMCADVSAATEDGKAYYEYFFTAYNTYTP